ncbi:MAG TPA: glycosyltransferase family 2 protein [Actinomycetota bacterium]|jgi:glycosyltransferase involved in cell wall biosynthesis|nr:glycosyltransferase family 2 protein [Actinomycetota bacterium]
MVDVVLPVLNEGEALPWVLGRMPHWSRAIVVDNGSTDGSPEIARSLGAIVVREPVRGFGAACHAGLSASESDLVCFMDCDASLDPQDLWRVVQPVSTDRSDLVLGRRIPDPGAWARHARWGNRLVAWRIGRRVGVRLRDIGPMRAARRSDLAALGVRDRRFGWPFEMVLLAGSAGWRIQETPVRYRPRTGTSKVTGTVGGTVRAVRDLSEVMRCS